MSKSSSHNTIHMEGRVFGRLTVVRRNGIDKNRQAVWRCLCECGNEVDVLGGNLRRGMQSSCGCLRAEVTKARSITHGEYIGGNVTSEAHTLKNCIGRCHNPTHSRYHDYGGRGIYVCDRWRFGEDGKSWIECFLADMGRRPGKTMQLDRIDNDGPYAPWNCRWVTPSENSRNRRPKSR